LKKLNFFIHQFLSKALSSQLESILDKEQEQLSTDNNNESGIGGGTGGGTNFWNSDESYEDYYNEGTHAWSFVLHVVVFVGFMSISVYIYICQSISFFKYVIILLLFVIAIVNRSGHDCPYSLRIMACLLLYEITSFLRETYDTLPKLSSIHPTGMNFRQPQQQRGNNQGTSAPPTLVETSSTLTDKRSNDRIRMGSVVSQTSNRSSASISSEHPARMLILISN